MVCQNYLTQSFFLGFVFTTSAHITSVYGDAFDVRFSIGSPTVPIKEKVPLGISFESLDNTGMMFGNKETCTTNLERAFGRPIPVLLNEAIPNTGVFDCGASKESLPDLMSHSNVARSLEWLKTEVAKAEKRHASYYITQSNNQSCGTGVDSSVFASSLWVVDSIMRAIILGVNRVYLHQASGAHNRFSLWDDSKVSASYYGVYLASLALRKATRLSILQNADEQRSVYAFFHDQDLIQLLLLNSVYYGNKNEPKSVTRFIISGLPADQAKAKVFLLTAPDANDEGPTVGGSFFDKTTCAMSATLGFEERTIENGVLEIPARDSQALLVTLTKFDALQ